MSGSVRPSVCHTFFKMFLSSDHHNIFQELLPSTDVVSMHKVIIRGHNSRSQRSKQILPHYGRFPTVTPVIIHRCLRNDTHSLTWCRRGAILLFEGIWQISKSHGPENFLLWPKFRTLAWIHRWIRNKTQSLKGQKICSYCFSRSSVKFQGHKRPSIDNFDPNWSALLFLGFIWQISKSDGPQNRQVWPELMVSGE